MLVTAAPVGWAGERHFTFRASEPELSVDSSQNILAIKNKAAVYDTRNATAKQYRCGALSSPVVMRGDFTVETDFKIQQQDHWNSVALTVKSLDNGKFGARVARVQESVGQRFLFSEIDDAGNKTPQKVADGSMAGTFRLQRTGDTVTSAFRPVGGNWRELAKNTVHYTGPVKAAVTFDTPPGTNSVIAITGLRQQWTLDTPRDFAAAPAPAETYAQHQEINWNNPDALTINGIAGLLTVADGMLTYGTAASDGKQYRFAGASADPVLGGDFCVETEFSINRMDYWNGMRLSVNSITNDKFTANFSRAQKAQDHHVFVITTTAGDKKDEKEMLTAERQGTMRIERRGKTITYSFCPANGVWKELYRTTVDAVPPVRAALGFDTPPSTNCQIGITALRLFWSERVSTAFAPVYLPFRKVADAIPLYHDQTTENADGSWNIAPGGRMIFAATCRPTSRAWTLHWQSQGELKIKCIMPGSAETLQLSDTVQWDAVMPETRKYQERSVGLEPYLLRFPNERNWPLSHVTSHGVFYFEVSPVGKAAIRFGSPELWAHELKRPEPPVTASTVTASGTVNGPYTLLSWAVPDHLTGTLSGIPKITLSNCCGVPYRTVPTVLSPKKPAITIEINRYAGQLHILHVAGKQPDGAAEIAAAYLIVYEDGATEPLFATLRWNCGVYADGYLAARGADTTWWGPPGFGWGQAVYLPQGIYGTTWNTLYSFSVRNPSPEKKIKSLIAYQMPGDPRDFALCGVTLEAPEHTVIGVVEPDRAAFAAGEPLGLNVYEYRSVPTPHAEADMEMVKTAQRRKVGRVTINRSGQLGAGRLELTPSAGPLDVGPVQFVAGDVISSRVSLMSKPQPDDKPFYYMMIAGGHEGDTDWDRIVRIGFDGVKIHIGWQLDNDGNPDFSAWPDRFQRIERHGLKISVRNLFSAPKEFRAKIPLLQSLTTGGQVETTEYPSDATNPYYREKVVDYYRRVGQLVLKFIPDAITINANYGQRSWICSSQKIAYSDSTLKVYALYLEKHFTLDELNRRTGLNVKSFRELTPPMILNDKTNTLLPAYSRANTENGEQLIAAIAAAVRATGCKTNFAFNISSVSTEGAAGCETIGQYLRAGMKYGPGSPFHEACERYALSMYKWLAAKRTFGLPYGDEICQAPPTYEAAMFAYMWMGMFQSFESNYCQWWGGKTTTPDIAQLKAYHQLLFNAEYLPNPVALAVSIDSGHERMPEYIHRQAHGDERFTHVGFGNTLRELNINPDRYMIDEFPEVDKNIKSRLLVDDNTCAMPTAFGDRIEKFIRNGGVFLATLETDRLKNYAFFQRFGIGVRNNQLEGVNLQKGVFAMAEKTVGRGKLVILCCDWAYSWDPGRSEPERKFLRQLFSRLGGFKPLVSSSFADVFVTPYRAKNGDGLISCINITVLPRKVTVGFAKSLVKGEFTVRDLGTGAVLPVREANGEYQVTTDVPNLNTTVLRIRSK